MVFSFRTGFYANGEVRMESQLVAKHYVQTFFIFDCISNFPLSLILSTHKKNQKTIKLLKLQKLPKLLRFGVLLKVMRQYAKYYQLLVSVSSVVLMLHMFTYVAFSLPTQRLYIYLSISIYLSIYIYIYIYIDVLLWKKTSPLCEHDRCLWIYFVNDCDANVVSTSSSPAYFIVGCDLDSVSVVQYIYIYVILYVCRHGRCITKPCML
jgi:hypothetical protein